MDTPQGDQLTWHEDDRLHQVEGMLSARLGTTIDETVTAIHRRAEASELTLLEAATGMLDTTATETR